MIGASRFERPTPCSQGRCATRLRHAPTLNRLTYPADALNVAREFRLIHPQWLPLEATAASAHAAWSAHLCLPRNTRKTVPHPRILRNAPKVRVYGEKLISLELLFS